MKKLLHKRLNQVVDLAWRSVSRLGSAGDARHRGTPLVSDDPSLCEELMRDMAAAEAVFQPTNYWQVYQERLMPLLRADGVRKFRASAAKVYGSFGMSQVPSTLKYLPPFSLNGKTCETHPSDVINQFQRSLQAFYDMCFYSALQQDARILEISDSGHGCPADLFSPAVYPQNRYTLSFLRYFHHTLWVRKFVDFNKVRVLMELGSGYGGQIEVLRKLFPHIHYVLCDIPPQVYVAEQYLKSVFPGEVTGYHETKAMDAVDLNKPAGITILAPWQLKKIKGSADFFWSATTFQEMEPEIVQMYLDLVQPRVSRYIYLIQLPKGQHVAPRKGAPGVLKPVTTADYIRFLDRFSLLQEEQAVFFATGQQGIPYYEFNNHRHFLFGKKS